MSLLSSSRALARHASLLPPELVVACLHTSASLSAPKAPRSRTRLVKDLKPRSAKGKGTLVIASEPKPEAKFMRDGAPHSAPGTRDRFKTREEDLQRAREWKQRRDARVAKRDAAEDRKAGSKAKRPSLRGWEESMKNVRQARPATEDVPDYDQPWRTRKSELWKPVKVDNFGMRQAAERSAMVKAPVPSKTQVQNPLSDEFDLSSRAASTQELPTEFTSPPLMEGLHISVADVLGPHARPTPIQALSLKHLCTKSGDGGEYVQCLLASETGSGKSIAYLLPMLQDLKLSELQPDAAKASASQLPLAPRALVLSPTHELSRQLSGFAKALLHEIKLRVLCVSQANLPSTLSRNVTASKMSKELDFDELGSQEGAQRKTARPVDVMVGTPAKILELVKGRGWDREQPQIEDTWDKNAPKPRKFTIGKPEMGLERIEWVVVDEADVLFGACLVSCGVSGGSLPRSSRP